MTKKYELYLVDLLTGIEKKAGEIEDKIICDSLFRIIVKIQGEITKINELDKGRNMKILNLFLTGIGREL